MAQHVFTSARPAPEPGSESAEEARPLPMFQFTLDGVKFDCVLPVSAAGMLAWSKLAAGADDNAANMATAAGAAFVYRFFSLFLGPEYPRFEAHLGSHDTSPDVLLEIMQALDAAFEEETEKSAGRPTPKPQPSSRGLAEREGRTLRALSLARYGGEIDLVDPPGQTA